MRTPMPWLTPTVFKQDKGESLTALPRFPRHAKPPRFRHVLHLYRDPATPANNLAQEITLDSIRQARRFAGPDCPVEVVAVTFPEDVALIPDDMIAAPTLSRDASAVGPFREYRRLPLLFDVLRNGCDDGETVRDQAEGEDEYIVFTNADITLQPTFYLALRALMTDGWDAVTVNRRTIAQPPEDRPFSPLYFAETGEEHGGFDCFVFPSRMRARFFAGEGCCGAGAVMRGLLFNLAANAERFLMLTQANLTLHLGNDKYWSDPRFADYVAHNRAVAIKTARALAREPIHAERLEAFITAHEGPRFRRLLPLATQTM